MPDLPVTQTCQEPSEGNTMQQTDGEDVEYLSEERKNLSEEGQLAKRTLQVSICRQSSEYMHLHIQSHVSAKFRHLCGVKAKATWPKASEQRMSGFGHAYLTPDFTSTVDDMHNREIFQRIADVLYDELEV